MASVTLAEVGGDRRPIEFLDEVGFVDIAARADFRRPHVIGSRCEGDPVFGAVVVLDADFCFRRQVVTHAEGDRRAALARRRLGIEEGAGHQSLETELRRDVVVRMGDAQARVAEDGEVAGADLLEGAHETDTQPINVTEVGFGLGVTEIGVLHRRRIENVDAAVPLQPDA